MLGEYLALIHQSGSMEPWVMAWAQSTMGHRIWHTGTQVTDTSLQLHGR